MKLSEQVVLITGASRGLGEAAARAFIREGSRVVINYFQSEEKAKKMAEEFGEQAVAIYADVRVKEDVENMAAEAKRVFGAPVTTVVNNALIDFKFDPAAQKNAEDLDWNNFQTQLEGSVKGAFHTMQATLEDMKQAGYGRIISIGTNLVQNPVVAYHEYTTGKAALLGFTRNMAKELSAQGITVNMVSGGLLRETDASKVTTEEVFRIIEVTTPRQKVTTPEEVADAVLFFASPWSRAVTGQNLIVDGGLVMQ